jgi:hypothetical protein
VLEVVAPRGVAWRSTARFEDKKMTLVGPGRGERVLAIEAGVVDDDSGIEMVLVREAWGRNAEAWLPLEAPSGDALLVPRTRDAVVRELGEPMRRGQTPEGESSESSYESSYDEGGDDFDGDAPVPASGRGASRDAVSRRMERMSQRITAKNIEVMRERQRLGRRPPPLPALPRRGRSPRGASPRSAAARAANRRSREMETEGAFLHGGGANLQAMRSSDRARPNSLAVVSDWIVGQRDGVPFYFNTKTGESSTKTPKALRTSESRTKKSKKKKKRGFFSKLFRKKSRRRPSSADEEEASAGGEYTDEDAFDENEEAFDEEDEDNGEYSYDEEYDYE